MMEMLDLPLPVPQLVTAWPGQFHSRSLNKFAIGPMPNVAFERSMAWPISRDGFGRCQALPVNSSKTSTSGRAPTCRQGSADILEAVWNRKVSSVPCVIVLIQWAPSLEGFTYLQVLRNEWKELLLLIFVEALGALVEVRSFQQRNSGAKLQTHTLIFSSMCPSSFQVHTRF